MATQEKVDAYLEVQRLRHNVLNVGRDVAVEYLDTAPDQRTPVEQDPRYIAADREYQIALAEFHGDVEFVTN